jgi:hypothetical protein
MSSSVGDLATVQSDAAGAVGTENYPFASVASFADEDPSTGRPLLLLSTLERNVINMEENSRVTLAIHETPQGNCEPSEEYEPMSSPRTTLFGTLIPVGGMFYCHRFYFHHTTLLIIAMDSLHAQLQLAH